MNDTHPLVEKKIKDMIQTKTPAERFQMGCSMFDTAKTLATAAIRAENAHLSEKELRQKIFLRFYKDDFDQRQAERILAWLS